MKIDVLLFPGSRDSVRQDRGAVVQSSQTATRWLHCYGGGRLEVSLRKPASDHNDLKFSKSETSGSSLVIIKLKSKEPRADSKALLLEPTWKI